MGRTDRRVQSALRYNPDQDAGLKPDKVQKIVQPRLMTDEEAQAAFLSFVGERVAADYVALLQSQNSVSLQRIWSRVAEGTQSLAQMKAVFESFAKQMMLSEPSGKRLWDWITQGALAVRASEVYEVSLNFLQQQGCAVPYHRGGNDEKKRGRVTNRR